MRNSRKARDDNATGYTVSSQDTRTMGWPWLAAVFLRFDERCSVTDPVLVILP